MLAEWIKVDSEWEDKRESTERWEDWKEVAGKESMVW